MTGLPSYLQPGAPRPELPGLEAVFDRPPFVLADFVGRALAFLQSREAAGMGFRFQEAAVLPCTWKCVDESLFGLDLILLAYTGRYPFAKGLMGGFFNRAALGAAVHHGPINLDFGGGHVGYQPGPDGGSFGRVWRPQHGHDSTDCGYLMALLAPFVETYRKAGQDILLHCPDGDRVVVSLPQEYLRPEASGQRVRLLVDLAALTSGPVPPGRAEPEAGRSLFYAHPEFLSRLPADQAGLFRSPRPQPIGRHLSEAYFNIFDSQAEVDQAGLPRPRLLQFMNSVVSDRQTPPGLAISLVDTCLEHQSLVQAVREPDFEPCAFASFSGVFLDLYDQDLDDYVNLFQPLSLLLKPAGQSRGLELGPEEVHQCLEGLKPVEPRRPLAQVLGFEPPADLIERFTFRPGFFREPEEPAGHA